MNFIIIRLFFYRTIGDLYEATLGALVHELGHIFDLGHDQEGIMANKFINIRGAFSPMISKETKMRTATDKSKVFAVCLNAVELSEDLACFPFSSAAILFHHK